MTVKEIENIDQIKTIQKDLHNQFISWVKKRRGKRLKAKDTELFNAGIWSGAKSKELGLIQKKYKKFVDIGSYPFFRLGKIGVAIVSRSVSLTKLKKVNIELLKLVKIKKIKVLKI